jgi:signal transduction histidine kinase
MYGDRADPYQGLSRLAGRLEDSVTPQMALRTIVETVADSLKVPFVSVDLVQAESGQRQVLRRAAVHGECEPVEPLVVPLIFQAETVGELVVGHRQGEELSAADHRLLTELARHAGAVVHATRLTIELQASRERLVVAQEDVRRRLRRDLHDGLGPTLASAVFQVDIARDALPADAAEAGGQLDVLRGQLQDAVESIRGMSYALRPPALDNGLVAAITEQISSLSTRGSTPRVTLNAPPSMPPLSPAVETAAYRIAMEAVANATRHSGARTCAIRLDLNGGLEVEVVDDGCAADGRPFRPGVGITSMRERAAELGAALTIEQRPAGTRVHTVLPVGAE